MLAIIPQNWNKQISPQTVAKQPVKRVNCCVASINLNCSPTNHYNKLSFGALPYKFVETFKDVPANPETYKYFNSKYPLLAKYIPQSQYGVVKYTGKSTERYMATTGCYPCSKLTMYDTENKVGFLSHVGDGKKLFNTSKNIQKSLLEKGANFKNLVLRHISGERETPKWNIQAIHELMEKLKLKPEQLVEENVLGGIHKDGIVLDLDNGQTYEIDTPNNLFLGIFNYPPNFENLKKHYMYSRPLPETRFNEEEIQKLIKEASVINDGQVDFNNPFFVEIK